MTTNYFVPDEMKKLNQWILWKLEVDEKGKQTKIPYSANYEGRASTTNSTTWTSYENAKKKFDESKYSGIGFVFTKDTGITFIDLDHVIEGDVLNNIAQNITGAFSNTYMELSQSGSGIHIFAKGNIERAVKKPQIELYDSGRYVAFTGNSINCCQITNKQKEINILHEKYADKEIERVVTRVEPLYLNEYEIIERIKASKQGEKFYYYFNGGAEPNSENTLALARILAFWCANDFSMIKSLMYKSELVRKKFDRRTAGRTWLDYVIDKAIKSTTDVYNPTVKNEYIVKEISKQEIIDLDMKDCEKKLYYTFNEFGYDTNSKDRLLTGIKQLDYMIKGFELGCVSLWTSATNGGKTTMMTMIIRETIKQGEKVFMFNGEQTKEDFKNNLYKQSVTSNNIYDVKYKDTNIHDYYVKDTVLEELKKLYGDNVILFDNENKRDINTLLYAMNEVHELYGVKMFVLDNLMQIDITNTNNIYLEQTELMEQLRTFAVNKKVHINLVAHPKKDADNLIRPSIYSVSGSMNITNKAFNVCSLIRKDHLDKAGKEYKSLKKYLLNNRYNIEDCDEIIEVLKTKGEYCGVIGLTYDSLRKTYIEIERMTETQVAALKREEKEAREWENPFEKEG